MIILQRASVAVYMILTQRIVVSIFYAAVAATFKIMNLTQCDRKNTFNSWRLNETREKLTMAERQAEEIMKKEMGFRAENEFYVYERNFFSLRL